MLDDVFGLGGVWVVSGGGLVSVGSVSECSELGEDSQPSPSQPRPPRAKPPRHPQAPSQTRTASPS